MTPSLPYHFRGLGAVLAGFIRSLSSGTFSASAIRSAVLNAGSDLCPFSMRAYAGCVSPARSATCCWVSFSFLRRSAIACGSITIRRGMLPRDSEKSIYPNGNSVH